MTIAWYLCIIMCRWHACLIFLFCVRDETSSSEGYSRHLYIAAVDHVKLMYIALVIHVSMVTKTWAIHSFQYNGSSSHPLLFLMYGELKAA